MALVVFDQGESMLLQMALNKSAQADLVIDLFTNNVTPTETHTEANYTVMGATQGYTQKTLTGANWTISGTTPTLATQSELTWTFTPAGGPTNIYGYVVKKGTLALWAETFSGGPWVVQNDGDVIKVTPKLSLE